jgi:hypothetical protein
VLFNQVGIQIGNLSVISPFLVICIFLLIYLYQLISGRVIPRAYSKDEKQAAIDALAVSLLLARDRRKAALSQAEMQGVQISKHQRFQHLLGHPLMEGNSERNPSIISMASSSIHSDVLHSAVDSKGHSTAANRMATPPTTIESHQQSMLLWQLIECLEEDAALYQNAYQLKHEVTEQRDKIDVTWQALRSTTEKIKEKITNKQQPSSSLEITTNPLMTSHHTNTVDEEKASASQEVELSAWSAVSDTSSSSSSSTASSTQWTILNKASHSAGDVHQVSVVIENSSLVQVTTAIKAFLIQVDEVYEVIILSDEENNLSKQSEMQQKYWLLVSEVSTFISSMNLSTLRFASLNSISQQEDYVKLCSTLRDLMIVHAALSLNVDKRVIQHHYQYKIAYQMIDKIYGWNDFQVELQQKQQAQHALFTADD